MNELSARELLWKIFPPYEVTVTLRAARRLMAEGGSLFTRSGIEPAVFALIKNAERTVHSIRIDGKKPDELAIILITNVIFEHLRSGNHHIYRGALSLNGSELMNLWNRTQAAAIERGYSTAEEARSRTQQLLEQIQSVG